MTHDWDKGEFTTSGPNGTATITKSKSNGYCMTVNIPPSSEERIPSSEERLEQRSHMAAFLAEQEQEQEVSLSLFSLSLFLKKKFVLIHLLLNKVFFIIIIINMIYFSFLFFSFLFFSTNHLNNP
jgi:hypothetical protein